MTELGVIGLGSIFPTQAEALRLLWHDFHIAAVCDVAPEKRDAFRRDILPVLPGARPAVYAEADALFRHPGLDAVLIATPPAAHYALALTGLRQGTDILLEKPATVNWDELKALYEAADKARAHFHVAYHASFARDLEWYAAHHLELIAAPLCAVECGFFDPYMENGAVLPQKRSLGGCYIDSGVNALSVCARLADLSRFRLSAKAELRERGREACVISAEHRFSAPGCEITIHTGWDRGLNQKTTLLRYARTDRQVLLDHSNQSVVLLDGGQRRTVFEYGAHPRLLTHYLGVFGDYAAARAAGVMNRRKTMLIHELLLS